MPNVVFVHPDGRRETVPATTGQSLMRVATDHLVEGIVGECGGDLSCATCHVFVAPEWADMLPPRSPEEEDMLEVTAEEPTEFSRLCCQIAVTPERDGITVRLPEIQQ